MITQLSERECFSSLGSDEMFAFYLHLELAKTFPFRTTLLYFASNLVASQ